MRLLLDIDGLLLEFVEPRAAGPYPWLVKIGTLLLGARAGHLQGVGVRESANVTVELDNAGKRAAGLLGRPLRARGWLYDNDGDLLLAGLIQRVRYGRTLAITLEA